MREMGISSIVAIPKQWCLSGDRHGTGFCASTNRYFSGTKACTSWEPRDFYSWARWSWA